MKPDKDIERCVELIMKAIRDSGQDKMVLLKQLKKSNARLERMTKKRKML